MGELILATIYAFIAHSLCLLKDHQHLWLTLKPQNMGSNSVILNTYCKQISPRRERERERIDDVER